DAAFEEAPAQARQSAGALSDWFRTEPERGAEADLDAFRNAYEGVADSCRETSAAARWAVGPGEDGAKPAALVCADVFDTPGTLTHFANANVLTSNMFKLVGLSPREVPADRQQDVRDTADLLSAEIAAVDDDEVRAALDQVRAPFLDALEGDTWSDGLRDPPRVRRAARPTHRARHRRRGGRLLLPGDRRGRRRRVGRRPRRGPARHEPGRTLMSTLDVIAATTGRAHGLRGEVALTLRTDQ